MKDREELLLARLREATRALRATLDERDALAKERSEPIAIVGIGCRLPGGANSPQAFWDLLAAGRDTVVPLEPRWTRLGVQPEELLPRWAALLTEPIDEFEPAFFGIAPREARSMDPQQRLLLEVAWEALEDAGIAPLSLKQSRTGVFVGVCTDDYSTLVERQPAAEKDAYSTTGNMLSILTGRLSYTLGLQGPCFAIDTACSSSLVAIHLACKSLRSRESELALAGGVNLIMSLDSTTGLSRIQALSPDGRCRTFDALANGYVRGEGCGLLVLKRLGDAQRDGDRIWAVVRGSALNQDGRSTGLTAPNVLAQEALLREALKDAGVEPEAVGYVETHGTGTSLGDPIEVQALRAVLGKPRADGGRCLLGAVKTNIGHLEGAAGVAGVIKAALVLAREQIPQNLHLRTLNAHIELDGSSLALATEASEWPRGDKPRFAGTSGFGLSGTNVHVVLQEAPVGVSKPAAPARPAELVVLAGRTEAALHAQAARLRQHLQAHGEATLGDLAHSLATTRSALEHRLAIVATTREELLPLLDGAALGQLPAGASIGTAAARRKLAFLFSGQGTQSLGMGHGLYATFPAFREAFDRCTALFDTTLPRPLRAVMWAAAGSADAALLDQTGYTQPALFALEFALSELWRSFGVLPDFVAGHSIGELVAACVAGVFTLTDATRLCAARAKLMQELPAGGAMVSIAASEAEVNAALAPHRKVVSIASINSPEQVVIAGDQAAVMQLAAGFSARGVRTKALPVSHAFHSPQMEPILAPFRAVAETISYQRPALPLVSNLTGALVTDEICHAEYWVQHVRQAVRFAAGLKALQEAGARMFIELGPKATLLALVPALADGQLRLSPSLRGVHNEAASVLEALGCVWTQGGAVDWRGVFPAGRRWLALPTYAWQRQRCWVEPPVSLDEAPPAQKERGRVHRGGHPLLGEVLRLSTQPNTLLWDTTLQSHRPAWIGDHRLKRAVVFPGAGHLEMALTAGLEGFGAAPFSICELSLIEALVVPETGSVELQVETSQERAGRVKFQVASRQLIKGQLGFRVHSRAVLQRVDGQPPPARLDLHALRARMRAAPPAASFYAAMHAMGVELGSSFQGLRELWQGDGEALGRVLLPEAAGSDAGYRFHPALLDACLQVMAGCFGTEHETTPWVPVHIGKLQLLQRPIGELYCHVRAVATNAETADKRCAELCVADGAGAVVAEISGLVVQRLAGARRFEPDDWYLGVQWPTAPTLAATLTPGRWLLLGGVSGLADRLGAALLRAGHAVHYVAELPGSAEALRDLLTASFAGQPPTAVVHLASLDEHRSAAESGPAPSAQRSCASVLRTVQALIEKGYRDVPRLWLLTRGAQAVGSIELALQQAPVLGLGRTIALEHPELRCARLDLDPVPSGDEIAQILAELLADDGEEEIAVRGGARRVARLVHQAPPRGPREQSEPARGRPFRLELDTPGILDDLVLRATAPRPPGPGEVEISVEAAGLNFRDVLLALGVIPSEPELENEPAPQLGSECAGRIVAVGPGVQGLAVGDAVIAVAAGCFATHLTCSAVLVLQRPHGTASEQAAIPVAFLTAYYALGKLARLAAGERVLIHGASGAVGLAAIQWARHVGAEVYATAGSVEKRAYLASLGVFYVSDSRSAQFVEDVRTWTGGEGVDVVLNSLSGELIPKSLELLRDEGRFVELGKRDYYDNVQLGMQPFLRNLTFSLLDLRGLLKRQPERMRQALREVMELFDQGVFSVPRTECIAIEDAAAAFRKMAQAQHIGKIVLTTSSADTRIRVPVSQQRAMRKDSSYLVSGGLGGLGLSVADWLAEQGAGQLVLMSRSGIKNAAQEVAVAALRARGTQVMVAQVDVTDRNAVETMLRQVSESGKPLRGVVHAAGVIDDGVLMQQTAERLARVMMPKVQGAWNLHELTRELPLDFFVMYSSAAGLLGSPGQGNYAAANTFLDALAHKRRAEGLPGLSIDWGVFSEVGLAVAEKKRAEGLALRGMRSITPAEGLKVLGELLGASVVQVGVVPLNLRQWGAFHQVAAASSRLSELRKDAEKPEGREGDKELLAQLGAAPPASRAQLIAEHLRAQVAHVLRIPAAELDASAPLNSLGLDSLMALELRNHIESTFGLRVPVTLLWTYPTLATLCAHLAGELFSASAAGAALPPVAVQMEPEAAPLDDSQLFAMLDDELALARKPGA